MFNKATCLLTYLPGRLKHGVYYIFFSKIRI